eukprot:scaffold128945_cov63-Phaeocystis_antarctica.AAC.2
MVRVRCSCAPILTTTYGSDEVPPRSAPFRPDALRTSTRSAPCPCSRSCTAAPGCVGCAGSRATSGLMLSGRMLCGSPRETSSLMLCACPRDTAWARRCCIAFS